MTNTCVASRSSGASLLPSNLQRFAISDDGCWLWQGYINEDGYGRFWNPGGTPNAHAGVYEAMVGPVPGGLELDHLCRVRHCVNPDHLEPVTHAENMRRSAEARTTCINGHPWVEENIYTYPSGVRQCRTCRREAGAKHTKTETGARRCSRCNGPLSLRPGSKRRSCTMCRSAASREWRR